MCIMLVLIEEVKLLNESNSLVFHFILYKKIFYKSRKKNLNKPMSTDRAGVRGE